MTRRRAQGLVEFTLIAVFLILLMAGTVDVARLITTYTYLDNAAQEGAVYGAMRPGDVTGLRQRVWDTTRSLFPNPETQVRVNVTYHTQPCPGHFVQVQVAGDLQLIFPFAEVFLASRTITLQATAQQLILTRDAAVCP